MPSNATETIDVRILRLIGLEDVFDLDYDTYLTLLKEAMVKGRMPKTTIPPEEVELLTNEWKKVKSKKDKGRFKVKKKKITATSIKTGGIKGKRTGIKASKLLPAANGSDLETRVFNNERKITHLIKIVKLRKGNVDKQILDSVTSIADTLKQKKKLSDKEEEFDRKEEEEEKRKAAKSKLKERFKKVAQVAQKVIAPVQSILDKIINYFVMIFAGRVFLKLFNWFSNPDNKSKVDSIVRFLGTHWPKLLSLFLVFGTGLGRFIVRLASSLTAGAVKLLGAAAQLGASAGMKAGGKFLGMRAGRWKMLSKFMKGWKGKALGIGLTAVGTAVATHQISKGIEGSGNQEPEQGFSGGGKVSRLPGFSGGGMVGGFGKMMGGMGKMMGGVGMGAMFGPLGMIIGGLLSSKNDSNKPEGFVSGEEGVDKVPARLTEGEFVMSTGAVEKYGLDTLESMNAAGGGTNIPKVVNATTYASGGGLIAPRFKLGDWYKDSSGQHWERKGGEQMGHYWKKVAKAPSSGNMVQPPTGEKATDKPSTSSRQHTNIVRREEAKKRRAAKAAAHTAFLKDNVMAPKDGQMGYLNKKTGKWTAKDWTGGDRKRYMEKGGELSELKPQGFMRGLAGFGDIMSLGLTDFDRRGSVTEGGWQYNPLSGGVDKQWGSERNLSPELKAKKASQANLDKLSNEGKGTKIGEEWHTNYASPIKSKGKRFDAEEAARSESIKERGGWLGQLNRALNTRLLGDRDIKAEDKAATARVKQKGAESIGKYYSSSDGKYYGNYQQAVDARKERLAQLSKDQTAAKKKAPPPPSTPTQQGTGDILEKIKEAQQQESVSNPSVPSTPTIPNARGGHAVAPKPVSLLGF